VRKKWWIWGLGILLAVALVAFVRSRAGSDDLVVQLVDKETGRPRGNLKVTVEEFDNIPLLYKFDFLPEVMRYRFSSRTTKSGADGNFRIRRKGGSGFPLSHIAVQAAHRTCGFWYGRGDFLVVTSGGGTDVGKAGKSFDVPKKGTLVIPLDPSWMR